MVEWLPNGWGQTQGILLIFSPMIPDPSWMSLATENGEQLPLSIDCCCMVPLTKSSRNLNELLVSCLTLMPKGSKPVEKAKGN